MWFLVGMTMRRVLAPAAVTVLACAAVGVWSYRTGHANGAARVQAKWDAERAAHARALIAVIEERDRATAAMTARTEALKREYKRETGRIAADRDRLLASLRDRPTTRAGDTGVPEGAAVGVADRAGCTGAHLSRPDSYFLIGEAARADQLRVALRACIAHNAAVESQLNEARSNDQDK